MPLLTKTATPISKSSKQKKRSPHSLVHLATHIFDTPLMIHPRKLDVILSVLGPRLGIRVDSLPPVTVELDPPDDTDADSGLQNGLAVIPLYGTLVKRAMPMDAMSGLTSYEDLRSQIDEAMSDDECTGILFDVDSPGGECAGLFDLADYIYSLRGQKPMSAIANDAMYSAAYAIGSAADSVYCTSVGGAGSVGVLMVHVDKTEQDKMDGLKYTIIRAGERKAEGNSHEPITDVALAALQAEVDRLRDMFVDLVARNRELNAKSVYDTKAACYYADGTVEEGLCDQVGSMQDVGEDMAAARAAASRSRVSMSGLRIERTRSRAIGARIFAGALPSHKTPVSDSAWDRAAAEATLQSGQPGSYYRKEYAWVDSEKDETKNTAYKFPHHEVSGYGDIGAANAKACQAGIAALNGCRGGTTIPSADREGVYAHLAAHLKDAGLEAPELKSEALALTAAMGSVCELDPTPLATVAAMYSLTGGPARIARHRYEGSDIELHMRHFATKAQVQASTRTITCCVAPYGQLSCDLGGFKEVYEPGCFAECLKQDDPRALFNHNPDYVLGRKSAGTARFFEQPDGLYFEADAPDTQWASDLLVSMRRGDITQGSAAFFILKPRWEYRGAQKVRVIEQAKLVESSIASFSAYESSTASVAEELAAAAALTNQQQVAAEQEQLKVRLRLLAA